MCVIIRMKNLKCPESGRQVISIVIKQKGWSKQALWYSILIFFFVISGIAYGMKLDAYWIAETVFDPLFSRHIYEIREKAKQDPDVGLSIVQILDKYGYNPDGWVSSPSERLVNQNFLFRQCDQELLYSGTGKRQPEPMFFGFKDLKCVGVIRGDLAKVLAQKN